MKKLIVLFVLAVFILGCASSVQQVKETPVLDDYKNKVDSLEMNIEKAEKKINSLGSEQEQLLSQRKKLGLKVDSLKAALDEAVSDYQKMKSKKEKAQGDLLRLRKDYQQKLDEKQKEIFDLESRIDVLKKDMSYKNDKVKEWNGLKEYYEKRIEKLETFLDKTEWFRLATYISFLVIFVLAIALGVVLYKK